jgi:hypothetical protein
MKIENCEPIITLNKTNNEASEYLKEIDYIDVNIIGWYGILFNLLLHIDLYNKKNPDNIITVYHKSKWGRLDISLNQENSSKEGFGELFELAMRVEEETSKTCQLCGSKGYGVYIKGWYWTLCDEHKKAMNLKGANYYNNIMFSKYLKEVKRKNKEQKKLKDKLFTGSTSYNKQ